MITTTPQFAATAYGYGPDQTKTSTMAATAYDFTNTPKTPTMDATAWSFA